MKNERKIYSNEKKKSSLQNQDLLVNFNFLLHENKELINKVLIILYYVDERSAIEEELFEKSE